jgi:aryl-alcohol dehydrogenase-like predicted oxidoreductase
MEKRKLGRSELEIAPFVLGGNVFGWTIDERVSFEVLDTFTEAGFNCIDTADIYSNWHPGHHGGESETVIGNWIRKKKNRQSIILATKVGGDMGEGKNLKKNYIIKAVEASLKRLQTDYIDLYQSHWDDPATPVEETLEAFSQLVKSGKVRAIGASNFTADRLKLSVETSEKNNWPRYDSLQPRYNMYDRKTFEKDLAPLCIENNIGVIPYYGLASGFLTGKYRSLKDEGKSVRGKGMTQYLNERGSRILDALDNVSKKYDVVPATIALAWLKSKPAITAPIASATSVTQLKELLALNEISHDTEDMRLLDAASEEIGEE